MEEEEEMAIKELKRGLELMTELWFSIHDHSEVVIGLCDGIMKSLENSLSFLNSMDNNISQASDQTNRRSDKAMKRSILRDQNLKVVPAKRRKVDLKKITTNSPFSDCYPWRKYGQKMIRNSEYPRCYYICSYKGCNAKKQVQQMNNLHPVPEYEVTIANEHTCNGTITQCQLLSPPSPMEFQLLSFDGNNSSIGTKCKQVYSRIRTENITTNNLEGFDSTAPMSAAGQFYESDASSYIGLEDPFDSFLPYA